MQVVLISNAKIQKVGDIKIDGSFTIDNLQVKQEQKSGNTVFIIDVHCTFKEAEKMQQQGGVIIYRYLLSKFKNCQEHLKVIFYSPISKDDLVRYRAENYILKLLPFVQTKFEEDGQFITELKKVINDLDKNEIKPSVDNQDFSKGWLQFNNASENLLSGWALANKRKIEKGQELRKINTNGKKILFIDDQQSEWKKCFSEIYAINTLLYLQNSKGQEIESQGAYKSKLKSNWDGFVSLTKKAIDNNPDLILSDFYLEENHDTTKWKDVSEIRKISGFKLFNEIRVLSPSIPYAFHTSSNKASIYKFLDANGVDDWMIKDIRSDSSKEEKRESFEEFKSCIEKFLCSYTYLQLNLIWKQIGNIDANTSTFWWNTRTYGKLKEAIIGILIESWFGLRRAAKKEFLFEKAIYNSTIGSEDSFTATSVINSMSKILELLGFASIRGKAAGNSGLAVVINSMRNIASHGRKDLNCFTIRDGILANLLLSDLLQQTGNRNDLINKFPKPTYTLYPKGSDESFKYALFWLYLQLYNSGYISLHLTKYKGVIEDRIREIFEIAKNDTGFVNTLNSVFSKYKVVEASILVRTIRQTATGNFEIASRT